MVLMTKKKRRLALIVTILVILLIMASVFLVLYLRTDMFKTSKTLFLKYLGKSGENLKSLEEVINKSNYDIQLETSPYDIRMEAKIGYTKDSGTTAENTANSVNQLKVLLEGQTDNNNQYNYYNMKLLKSDEQIAQAEYLHLGENYGIKFTDLFNQYLVSENTNLKEIFKKIGYTGDEIEDIPDSINLNMNFLNDLKLTDAEIETLSQRYATKVGSNLLDSNFSKQTNQQILIGGQNYIANAYILTLAKEELNNIYIDLLQSIKEDEIILSKIDILQNKLDEITLGKVSINIKEKFINDIDLKIKNISENNIGTDETRVIVYENNGETLRIRIETNESQTNIDYLTSEKGKFAEILIAKGEEEKYRITLDAEDTKYNLEISNAEKESLLTLTKTENINNQSRRQNYNLSYEIERKKVNISIAQNIEIKSLESKKNFNGENAVIMLDTLDEAQTKEIINTVREGLNTKLEDIKQQVNYQDIENMLKEIGILNKSDILSSTGITEVEKNRFNSNFEFVKGENLDRRKSEKFFSNNKKQYIRNASCFRFRIKNID